MMEHLEMLEKKVLHTRESKGKKEMIVGDILMGGGVTTASIGVINYLYEMVSQHKFLGINSDEDLKRLGIAMGIVSGVGLLIRTYGRIKHWYYNN